MAPQHSESLTPESSDEEIREAIMAIVEQLVSEGFNQEQAQAIALQEVSKATGRDLSPEPQSRSRSAI